MDEEALLSDDFFDLQAMIKIHEQWSEYASLKYDVTKCAFLCEEYWANRICVGRKLLSLPRARNIVTWHLTKILGE